MEPEIMNPDSAMMMQSEGNWQKYFALVLFKLAPNGVNITVDDMKAFGEQPNTVVLRMGTLIVLILNLLTGKLLKYCQTMKLLKEGHANE